MSRRLMVLSAGSIADWIDKGEVVDRYYNPCGLFDHVDIVTTSSDRPDPSKVQPMVGDATFALHNVPIPNGLFRRTLGFRPWLLGPWSRTLIELARSCSPSVIRCHGAELNAFAASRIRRKLGIPYAVSLHINPDEDVRGRSSRARDRLSYRLMESVAKVGLREADIVLPVYEPIVPYLKRLKVTRYEVAYNAVGGGHIQPKRDYALHRPVRVISVGRQLREKNPEHLIGAVAALDDVELLLVGDGPQHEHLERVARKSGAADRVHLRRAVPNVELCGLLAAHDVFATHTDYWELSKSLLEPLLTGLPVVLNRRSGPPVPELQDHVCLFVENTVAGYRTALELLISDDRAREDLGRRARAVAEERWSPGRAEAHFADVYRRLLDGRG